MSVLPYIFLTKLAHLFLESCVSSARWKISPEVTTNEPLFNRLASPRPLFHPERDEVFAECPLFRTSLARIDNGFVGASRTTEPSRARPPRLSNCAVPRSSSCTDTYGFDLLGRDPGGGNLG